VTRADPEFSEDLELEAASEAGESPVVLMHDSPLETEQWKGRRNDDETVDLLRMLIAEDRWTFGPPTRPSKTCSLSSSELDVDGQDGDRADRPVHTGWSASL
jgi:hypothetical protein